MIFKAFSEELRLINYEVEPNLEFEDLVLTDFLSVSIKMLN